MAYYPQSASGLGYITYPVGPAANVTYPTSSASTNTKGSYTELAASVSITSNAAIIYLTFVDTATARRTLYDFATGAGGAEVVVIPNLMNDASISGGGNSGDHMGCYWLPWKVASGTRVAARIACSVGSCQPGIGLTLIAAGGVDGITSFTNYGADTSDSGGLEVDPGGTIDTKGSYTQFTASSSAVIQSLTIGFSLQGNSAPQNTSWAYDIATGAAASEVVLIPDIRMNTAAQTVNAATALPRAVTMLTYISASTRIAIRASSTVNDATDRLTDLILLTGVAPSEPSGASGGAWAYC